MAKDKSNKEIQTKKAEVSKSTIKKELKRKAKDIDVEVMNLTNGKFIYECSKTRESISLEDPGDTATVSVDFLFNMKNKGILEGLLLSVIDTFTDEYSLGDIHELLGINKLYKECNMTLNELDNLIENSTNQKFEKIIEKAPDKVVERIAERAVLLSRDDKFDSNSKRNILIEKVNNKYLFNVI